MFQDVSVISIFFDFGSLGFLIHCAQEYSLSVFISQYLCIFFKHSFRDKLKVINV